MPQRPSRLTSRPPSRPPRPAGPRRCRRAALASLAASLLLTCPGFSHAATPEQVKEAIDKGKAFLLCKQLPGGHWEPDAKREGDRARLGEVAGRRLRRVTPPSAPTPCSPPARRRSRRRWPPPSSSSRRRTWSASTRSGSAARSGTCCPPDARRRPGIQGPAQAGPGPASERHQRPGSNRGMWDYGDGHGDGSSPRAGSTTASASTACWACGRWRRPARRSTAATGSCSTRSGASTSSPTAAGSTTARPSPVAGEASR